MLDQYDGYLICKVGSNDGRYAQCGIMDACAQDPSVSIEDEFWIGPDEIQIHAELLGLTKEDFRNEYPVGKEFLVEFRVRVLPYHIHAQQQSCTVQ
jgi:hypothetical protein